MKIWQKVIEAPLRFHVITNLIYAVRHALCAMRTLYLSLLNTQHDKGQVVVLGSATSELIHPVYDLLQQ